MHLTFLPSLGSKASSSMYRFEQLGHVTTMKDNSFTYLLMYCTGYTVFERRMQGRGHLYSSIILKKAVKVV